MLPGLKSYRCANQTGILPTSDNKLADGRHFVGMYAKSKRQEQSRPDKCLLKANDPLTPFPIEPCTLMLHKALNAAIMATSGVLNRFESAMLCPFQRTHCTRNVAYDQLEKNHVLLICVSYHLPPVASQQLHSLLFYPTLLKEHTPVSHAMSPFTQGFLLLIPLQWTQSSETW